MDCSPTAHSSFRQSLRLFRATPWRSMITGAALALAMFGAGCGFGLVIAPWFYVELAVLQLSAAQVTTVRWDVSRRHALFRAYGVFAVGIVAMCAVSTLSWVGLSVDLRGDGAAALPSVALGVLGLLLAVAAILPFLYTSLVLLEQGVSLAQAMTQSAYLARKQGTLRVALLSLRAHAFMALPVIALWFVPWGRVTTTTLASAFCAVGLGLSLTIPIGHGAIVASYLSARENFAAASEGHTLPSRPLMTALVALVMAPVFATLLVTVSLLRPAPLQWVAPSTASPHVVVEGAIDPKRTKSYWLQGTSIQVLFRERSLRIDAADGGGAGLVRLPDEQRATRFAVLRQGGAYVLRLVGTQTFETRIDGAGVRLDDDLPRRLQAALPRWGLVAILLSFLGAASRIGPSLARFGTPGARPAAVARYGWVTVALLSLSATLAIAAGIVAVIP